MLVRINPSSFVTTEENDESSRFVFATHIRRSVPNDKCVPSDLGQSRQSDRYRNTVWM